MLNPSPFKRPPAIFILVAALQSLTAVRAPADNFFITDTQQGVVLGYNSSGAATGTYGPPGSGGLFSTFQPSGIAADLSGNILVSDSQGNRIVKLSSTGDYIGVFATNGVNLPDGLAVDGSGNVYVANFTGGVLKFAPDGSSFTNFDNTQYDFGVAIDKSNDVFIANAFGGVAQYSPAGKALPPPGFAATGIAPLDTPEGLAFDAAGNLYVSNYGNGTVVKYSADGKTKSVFATNSLDGPEGLAFDSSGNLYVVNNGNFNNGGQHPLAGTVQKFGPDGTWLGRFVNTEGAPHFILITSGGSVTPPAPVVGLSAFVPATQGTPGTLTLQLGAEAAGFTLQASSALAAGPAGWSTYIAVTGATNVTLQLTNSTQFFRLAK